MMESKRTVRGFSLLELLVAIAVFSVLAMMAYGTLSNVLSYRNQTEQAAEQLNRVQKAMLHIQRDIMQIVVRPFRDEFGTQLNTLLGDEYGKYRLLFFRTGYPNPNLAPRSSLQRVAYVMPQDEENKLYRYVWPSLDGGAEDSARKLLLLDDVEELIIRFYDKGEEFQSWPPLTNAAAPIPTFDIMPQGIKIVLKLKSMGEIWRLMEIPGT